MTESEARGVLNQLMAWYPSKVVEDATQAVWVRALLKLHLETAREAADLAAERHSFFPSYAEFRACYDELMGAKLRQIEMIRRYCDTLPLPGTVEWFVWWKRDPEAANNWTVARAEMLRETRETERVLVPQQLVGGSRQLALPGGR